jgi:hypothetical protein
MFLSFLHSIIMRAVVLLPSSSFVSGIIAYSLTVTLVPIVTNVHLQEACAADLPVRFIGGQAVAVN